MAEIFLSYRPDLSIIKSSDILMDTNKTGYHNMGRTREDELLKKLGLGSGGTCL